MKLKQKYLWMFFILNIVSYPIFSTPQNSGKFIQQINKIIKTDLFSNTEKKLQKAIKESPNKQTYVQLANLYMSNNKNKKAIDNYQQATLLDPTDEKLFTSMSIAYLHLGFYSMSKAMAEQALTLNPKLKHANNIISYIDKKQEVLKKTSKYE